MFETCSIGQTPSSLERYLVPENDQNIYVTVLSSVVVYSSLHLCDHVCLFTRHCCIGYTKQCSGHQDVFEWQCDGCDVLYQSIV